MSRSTNTIYPGLVQAHELLADLAKAFESGTWEGLHKFALRNDVFSRLTAAGCECCGGGRGTDPLATLYRQIHDARHGVAHAKARREETK